MKKMLFAMMMAVVFCFTAMPQVHASWLGNVWKQVKNWPTTTTTSSRQPTAASVNKNGRWALVYQGDHYNVYVDMRTWKKSGEAQNRQVSGYFKREFNAIGSQWLGNISGGRVKPDVITHSVYRATYNVNSSNHNSANYYDVHNHLIYQGTLSDFYDEAQFGNYVPDSPNEQIKDTLFHAAGWDY